MYTFTTARIRIIDQTQCQGRVYSKSYVVSTHELPLLLKFQTHALLCRDTNCAHQVVREAIRRADTGRERVGVKCIECESSQTMRAHTSAFCSPFDEKAKLTNKAQGHTQTTTRMIQPSLDVLLTFEIHGCRFPARQLHAPVMETHTHSRGRHRNYTCFAFTNKYHCIGDTPTRRWTEHYMFSCSRTHRIVRHTRAHSHSHSHAGRTGAHVERTGAYSEHLISETHRHAGERNITCSSDDEQRT